MLLYLMLACGGVDPDDSVVSDTDTQDTGGELGLPVLTVDVLIVGSGPAGLSAALTALDADATFLVMEMAERAGGGAEYAQNFLIVGTEQQADVGVQDSLEIAAAEWPEFTKGGDGQDPVVRAYLGETRALADWFVTRLGATILGPRGDASAGKTPRIHSFDVAGETPGQAMLPLLDDWIWTNTRGDSLVVEQGQVIGVRYTDMETGEQGWVRAGATVVATGGFVRDLDRVLEHRPELEGLSVVFETHHLALGEGLEMLDGVGAQTQNQGAVGVYVHSAEDWRPGFEGEALWLPRLPQTVIVNQAGKRVGSEALATTFEMDDLLLSTEGRRLWVFYPQVVWESVDTLVPAYNVEGEDAGTLSHQEMEQMGVAQRFESVTQAATALGLSQDLVQTFEAYNGYAEAGVDLEFGKQHYDLRVFDEDFIALELVPGVAKCFAGISLGADGQVMDRDGAAIPGLYGAGEVAGMLGSPAIGAGFSGSISAVYWTGRRAGAAAVAYSGR